MKIKHQEETVKTIGFFHWHDNAFVKFLPAINYFCEFASSTTNVTIKVNTSMPYYEFLWTEETIEHVAEHDVSQEEFERIVRSPHSTSSSYFSGLPAAFGYADDGRLLICVYEHLDSVLILPVTAYEV